MNPVPHHTIEKGFTLVETLIAVTILLLVIIGPMTAAQKGIQNAYFANEQITAVFLAQEAIEAVREARDADALNVYDDDGSDTETSDWVTSIRSTCSSGCAYDVVNNTFESCTAQYNSSCVLKVDSAGNYNYEAGGTPSQFTRIVTVGAPVSGNVPVTVAVTWAGKVFGGTTRTVNLQTWVYDHYQRYEVD